MQSYLLFTSAFLVSVATPGPDIMVVIGKALALGRVSRCLPLISGIIAGKLLLLAAAFLGLSVLASALGSLFVVVKLGGAAYLAYLGVRLWRRPPRDGFDIGHFESGAAREIGLGLAMSIGNPIAILFYAALLPNVVDVERATFGTAAILMAIVGASTLFVYIAYALLAARARFLFRSSAAQQRVNRTSGAAMVGAAVLIAAR